jgi:hypothetical protein
MKKTIISIVIIVLVVIAAGAIGYYYHSKSAKAPSVQVTAVSQSQQPQPQFATSGQVTSSMPKNLVIGNDVTPNSSYTIPYDQANQSTTVYDTSDGMDSVYNQFLAYFKTNGYEVLNSSQSSTIDTVYAIISGSTPNDVNVTIKADGSKTEVVVSYLKK